MKGDMTSITKRQVLSDRKVCVDCKSFVKEHKKGKVASVCITTLYECKKCKLQFEVLQNNKLAYIWKVL